MALLPCGERVDASAGRTARSFACPRTLPSANAGTKEESSSSSTPETLSCEPAMLGFCFSSLLGLSTAGAYKKAKKKGARRQMHARCIHAHRMTFCVNCYSVYV